MSKRMLVGVVVYAILTASLQVGERDAQAEGSKEKSSPRHCISTNGGPVQCYDTEREALYVASGGHIRLAEGQSSASLSDEELFGPETSVQGTLYEHANYGGSTLTLYGDGCQIWNNMPAGWNDITSSVRNNSCGLTLYENTNMGGSTLNISSPGTSYVGNAMNDKASSWSIP